MPTPLAVALLGFSARDVGSFFSSAVYTVWRRGLSRPLAALILPRPVECVAGCSRTRCTSTWCSSSFPRRPTKCCGPTSGRSDISRCCSRRWDARLGVSWPLTTNGLCLPVRLTAISSVVVGAVFPRRATVVHLPAVQSTGVHPLPRRLSPRYQAPKPAGEPQDTRAEAVRFWQVRCSIVLFSCVVTVSRGLGSWCLF